MLLYFSQSADEIRNSVAKNIQAELLHSRTVILMMKRIISSTRTIWPLMVDVCVDANHAFLQFIENYSKTHEYWYVAAEGFHGFSDSIEELEKSKVDHETNFSLESYLKHYSSTDLVEFYTYALSDCQHKSVTFNHKVARYLYKICKASAGIYNSILKPSVLLQCTKALGGNNAWRGKNSELVTVCNSIVRRYSTFAKNDPLFVLSSFFN